jgi:glycosyltransferase involved in cell wall biosynthesis
VIIFLHARDPDVAGGGSDVRVNELARRIAEVTPLRVLEVGRPPPGFARISRGRLAAAALGIPPRLAQNFDVAARKTLQRELASASVIVANTMFSVPLVSPRLRVPVVVDAHNLEWQVVEQLAAIDDSPLRRAAYRATARWTKRYEARAATRADQVWAVSDDEARWFRAQGASDVVTIANGVAIPPRVTPLPSAPTLLFVGSLRGAFNRQGLSWFIDRCWPALRERVRGARLMVAGAGSGGFASDDIDALGFVADLTATYAKARVVIVPLLSGAGTRLKVVEGIAQGRPVVSTTLGASGVDVVADRDILIADSPEMFVHRCEEVLTDDALAQRLAAAGRARAEAVYDWDVIAALAAAKLAGLTE